MELTQTRALEITRKLLDINGKLNRSISDLMKSGCSGAQFNEYRRLVGRIMGYVYMDILKPVFDQYPDLEPKGSYSEVEQPLGREIAREILRLMGDVSSVVEEVARTYGDLLGEQVEQAVRQVEEASSDVRKFVHRSQRDLKDAD